MNTLQQLLSNDRHDARSRHQAHPGLEVLEDRVTPDSAGGLSGSVLAPTMMPNAAPGSTSTLPASTQPSNQLNGSPTTPLSQAGQGNQTQLSGIPGFASSQSNNGSQLNGAQNGSQSNGLFNSPAPFGQVNDPALAIGPNAGSTSGTTSSGGRDNGTPSGVTSGPFGSSNLGQGGFGGPPTSGGSGGSSPILTGTTLDAGDNPGNMPSTLGVAVSQLGPTVSHTNASINSGGGGLEDLSNRTATGSKRPSMAPPITQPQPMPRLLPKLPTGPAKPMLPSTQTQSSIAVDSEPVAWVDIVTETTTVVFADPKPALTPEVSISSLDHYFQAAELQEKPQAVVPNDNSVAVLSLVLTGLWASPPLADVAHKEDARRIR